MKNISKLFKETKLGDLMKEYGISLSGEKKIKEIEIKREEKRKEIEDRHNYHFSDNHKDDDWLY